MQTIISIEVICSILIIILVIWLIKTYQRLKDEQNKRLDAEKILESESEFKKLLTDQLPVIILVLNDDSTIDYVNPYFEGLFGDSLEKIKGGNWFELYLPERDHPRIKSLFDTILEDKKVTGNINPIIVKGQERYIEWYTRCLQTRLNGRQVLSIGLDVTERVEDKNNLMLNLGRLKDAQKKARIGNWELNQETRKLIWSDEVYKIFNLAKNQFDETHDAFLHAVHPDDLEMVKDTLNTSLQEKNPYELIYRLKLEDGIKYVKEFCDISFDENGRPLKIVGTVQDITESVHAKLKVEASE